MSSRLLLGDNRCLLPTRAENSIDCVVTDPPYDLVSIAKRFGKDNSAVCKAGVDGRFKRLSGGFMGAKWDSTGIAFDPTFWQAVLRVMKPGAHCLAFGGSRTAHRMACAMEDAGFELRDSLVAHGTLHWTYSTGFPKSHELADGIGTALKPSHEIIYLARKPFRGSAEKNFARWGTGGLNVDACRVKGVEAIRTPSRSDSLHAASNSLGESWSGEVDTSERFGRWPSNSLYIHHPLCAADVCHVECCVRRLGEMSGEGVSAVRRSEDIDAQVSTFTLGRTGVAARGHDDSGTAARFFAQFRYEPADLTPFVYCAKAARSERERGTSRLLDSCEIIRVQLHHYTKGGVIEWAEVDPKVMLRVDMARSVPKVIDGFGMSKSSVSAWNTFLFGNNTMGLSRVKCRCITGMETSSTMSSRILNCLTRLPISDCIRDVRCETGNGGNRVADAESSSPHLFITNGKAVSLPGVGNVASQTLWRISANASATPDEGAGNRVEIGNFHPT